MAVLLPSARLIMQQTPFPLPGGRTMPACSPYHMAQAPSLLLNTAPLGWGGSVTPQNATLCFLSSLSFSFFLLWASGDRKTEASISSSLHHSGNNGLFLLLIVGPCQWGPGFAVVEKGGGLGSVCQGPPALALKQLTDVSVHRRTANAIVASTVAGLGTSFHLSVSFECLAS